MINRFFLAIVLLPTSLYQKLGVNTNHLRAILLAKLTMDDRRPNSIHQTKKKQQTKPIKWSTVGTMLMMALLGSFFIIPFFITQDPTTQFTFYFTFFIFILASTLISDFTSVLIDVRDNYIILPKPVNDKTFLLSRLLHIIIHVSKLIIPMTLPGLIVTGIQKGFGGVAVFIFILPFATVFTIFLINAIYLIILKITTPEKFKSIISYFQIVFAIVIYGGYQIVPRLMDMTVLEKYQIQAYSWWMLAPSYWFGIAWKVLYSGGTSYEITLAVFSFAITLFSVWLIIKYFAPSFNQKLAMISGSEQSSEPITSTDQQLVNKTSLAEKLATIFTKKGGERMGFLITWHMTSRSRDFKMKTYPAIGYLIVYMAIFVLRNKKISFNSLVTDQKGAKIFVIFSVYMIGFVMMQALNNIKISDKYKAAWIYYITPIQQPGNILSGATKAIVAKFYLPIALIISALEVTVLGWKVIPNIVLGMSTQVCVSFIVAYLMMRSFPFSTTENTKLKGSTFVRGLFSLIVPIGMGILQYTVYEFTVVIVLLAGLSLIATWLMAGSVYQRDWKTITAAYRED